MKTGLNIYTTEIRVDDRDFAGQMTRMRLWLDSNRLEPAIFRHDHVDGHVVIRIDFPVEAEADAFAKEFGGQLRR